MTQAIVQTPVAQRLILVNHVAASGVEDVGETLEGLNVNPLPTGALAFVIGLNAIYRLKRNVPADTASFASGYANIVSSVGSPSGGRWVRQTQIGTVILVAGSGTISSFDLSGTGYFTITLLTAGGTQGFVRAVITNATTATLTSSNGADTGSYLVTYTETGTTI